MGELYVFWQQFCTYELQKPSNVPSGHVMSEEVELTQIPAIGIRTALDGQSADEEHLRMSGRFLETGCYRKTLSEWSSGVQPK